MAAGYFSEKKIRSIKVALTRFLFPCFVVLYIIQTDIYVPIAINKVKIGQ